MEETKTNPDPTPFKDAISGYKPLELVRALQDVQRLQEDNSKLKLELIALKEDPKLRANIELTDKKLDEYAEEIVRLTDIIQKYNE